VSRTVAIIGAGPIGLAAACSCLRRGYVPLVFEREAPGASLARFGPTRFFSPLSMNLPPELLALAGSTHDPSALLAGPEIAALLERAASCPTLAPHIRLRHRVVRVTRRVLSRGELAGHPVRAELPFRLVVATPDGERTFEADAVLDASGTYGNPVPLTAAGAGVLDAIRDLGALHAGRAELSGKPVMLLGHGHSAATALLALESIAREAEHTRVVWAVRSRNRRPVSVVPSDPLPERDRVVSRANALAENPPAWLRVERGAFVESFERLASGGLRATLAGERSAEVDHVVALVGYRPDLGLVSELPLEISPITEGAHRLWKALANVTDCLAVPRVKPEDLASGEARFHLVGAKSYGRARTFLLQTGFGQLETVLDGLFG
jgi:cation diffusion facilitator CzcD-associated flavoprotein CzcO